MHAQACCRCRGGFQIFAVDTQKTSPPKKQRQRQNTTLFLFEERAE